MTFVVLARLIQYFTGGWRNQTSHGNTLWVDIGKLLKRIESPVFLYVHFLCLPYTESSPNILSENSLSSYLHHINRHTTYHIYFQNSSNVLFFLNYYAKFYSKSLTPQRMGVATQRSFHNENDDRPLLDQCLTHLSISFCNLPFEEHHLFSAKPPRNKGFCSNWQNPRDCLLLVTPSSVLC